MSDIDKHASLLRHRIQNGSKKVWWYRPPSDEANRGSFVEQKLLLSLSFRRDQIYKRQRYDFGHTLLRYLSRTWVFNKPTSEAGSLST